jgi:hypothetical protein
VWDLIASGSARAVHHIESPAMISLCKMCNVRDIDTLIAIVSVIRPGAANESKKMEFARRYQGLSTVQYPHPSLEPCLRSTYGLVVYEEHILQMCEAFAGLPPGRADILRRALAKEKNRVDRSDSNRICRMRPQTGTHGSRNQRSLGPGGLVSAVMLFAKRTAPLTALKRINLPGLKLSTQPNSWRQCSPTAKAFTIHWFTSGMPSPWNSSSTALPQ